VYIRLPVYTELWSGHVSVLHDTNPASPTVSDAPRGDGPGAEDLPITTGGGLP